MEVDVGVAAEEVETALVAEMGEDVMDPSVKAGEVEEDEALSRRLRRTAASEMAAATSTKIATRMRYCSDQNHPFHPCEVGHRSTPLGLTLRYSLRQVGILSISSLVLFLPQHPLTLSCSTCP